MTKEEKILNKKRKKNIKLYYLYKIFSFDLLFYYAISFLYLNSYQGLSAAQIIFADAFYPIFKIIFQIPVSVLTEKFGKRTSLIVGNSSLALYIIFILGCKSTILLIISNIFMALGFVFKNLSESNLLYDSIPSTSTKQKLFSKIEGRSSAIFYIFDAFTCLLSGFLYIINPNIPIIMCLLCAVISFIICHFFTNLPDDITNPDSLHNKYENSISSLKQYTRNLKNAFKFIFSSKRLRSLIYFNAIQYSTIYLLISYRRSLLEDIGVNSQSIGIIFALLGIASGIGSILSHKINKLLKNKTLTYLGLYYAFSIILSGLVVALNIPYALMLTIIVLMLLIQFFIKGPYYTLIKQYLGSFSNSSMRVKILTANYIIEGIVASSLSFLGAGLLTITNTANASIIVGSSVFIILILLLEYMNSRVGLKPDEYKESEINFKEVV